MSVPELRSALEEFYSSDTHNDRKQQLDAALRSFKLQSNAHEVAIEILKQTADTDGQHVSDLYLIHFACSILEDCLLTRWQALAHSAEGLRDFLYNLVLQQWGRVPDWVCTKLTKAMLAVSMHTHVPWQNILQLVSVHESRQRGLFVLGLAIEECVRTDLLLPTQEKERLESEVTAQLPHILAQFTGIISECQGAIASSSAAPAQAACETLTAAQRCLLAILVWAPLSEHVSPALLGALLQVVQTAAAHPAEGPVSKCGADAVQCITEVLGKKLVPRHLQPLMMELANHMLAVLRALTQDGGAVLAAADETFILNLIGFLSALLERHLPRIIAADTSSSSSSSGSSSPNRNGNGNGGSSSGGRFPLGELLSLLAAFTFQQPDTEKLQQCLQPWCAFAAVITDTEAGEHVQAAAAEHAEGLGSVCEQLLYKVLFFSNSDGLEELDSEETAATPSSSTTAAAAAGALQLVDDDESSTLDGSAEEDQRTELDAFIAEVLSLLRLCAQLPPVGARLSAAALALFTEVLQRLGPAAAAAEGGAFTAARLAADAATLCGLVGAGRDGALNAAGAALEACSVMVTAQLHARGPAYAKLQVALLQALTRLAPALAAATAAADDQQQQHRALTTADGAAAAATTLLRSASSQPAPAESVQQAAAELLLSLAKALQPQCTARISSYSALLQEAPAVAGTLLPRPCTTLYLALAAYLLPVSGSADKAQQAQRAAAYRQLLTPLTGALAHQAAAAAADGRSVDFAAVCMSCRILTALCRAFCTLATRRSQKADFRDCITPALSPSLALLAPCLRASSATTTDSAAAAAAASLLRLLVAAVVAVGREFGAALANDILGALVSLFDTGQVSTEFGAGHGKAGLLLVSGMYKLLAGVLSTRSQAVQDLLPRATALSLQMLTACTSAAAAAAAGSPRSDATIRSSSSSSFDVLDAVMPDFLAVVASICDNQWHCFIESSTKPRQPTDNSSSSNNSSPTPQAVSNDAGTLFGQLFDAVCSCIQADTAAATVATTAEANATATSVPRRVTAGAIELLRRQHRSHGLFALPAFASDRLVLLLESVLSVLVAGGQPLLAEDLSALVRDVALVDETAFFQQFMPMFIAKHFPQLKDSQRSAVLSVCQQPGSGFETTLAACLNDLRYYAKQSA